MGIAEVSVWAAYFKKNGPHNAMRFYDRPAALQTTAIVRVNGGKAEMKEFLPYGIEEEYATMEDIIKLVGGVKNGQ